MTQGRVTHMVGSPFWMPPEMIQKVPHGLPTDLWSFGITLMELANGHPPHRRASIKAMFVAATVGYPQPFEEPERWSPEFGDFLSRCLRVNADERATAKELHTPPHPFLAKAATRDQMKVLFIKTYAVADACSSSGNGQRDLQPQEGSRNRLVRRIFLWIIKFCDDSFSLELYHSKLHTFTEAQFAAA